MRATRLLPVCCLASFVLVPDLTAAPYRFRPIALTGDPVPGVPGAQFTWLGVAPMGPDDPAPLIDAQGQVSFGAGWLQQVTPHGLFVWRQGTLSPVVLTGEPATGTGSTFASLPGIIPGPAKVSGARTSFDGGFMPPGESFIEQGVWADRTGSRELIFRQTDHPPGTPPGASFFQWFHTLVGDGHVVVNARYSVGSSSEINHHGFWRDDDGTLEVVALAGTQAPGVPAGVQFGNATGLALGAFQNWDLDDQGRISFHAMLMNGGATDLDDEGIWSEGPAGLQLIAREGGAAPGMGHPNARMLGNSGFRTFGHDDVVEVTRNDQGHLAFGARVDVPGFNNKANALYALRGAGLELVTFGMPSGSNVQGRPAPGFPAGHALKRFPLGFRMNGSGALAFSATTGTAGGSILDELPALFVERGGAIQLVARSGEQAAGQSPGVHYAVPFPIAFHDDGTVVFVSTLDNGGRGLFVAGADGVEAVLAIGSVIEVPEGSFRAVGSFSTTGQASDAGAFAISVNFQDGTDAILIAEPEALVAADPPGAGPRRLTVAGANPFVRGTALAFELDRRAAVRLAVHDPSGREVAVLLEGAREAGRHLVNWDGHDRAGRRVGAGVYFATLEAGDLRLRTKLVALR